MAEKSWSSSAATRATMQGNRPRDTAPEWALRRAVHRLGLRYRVAARPIAHIHRTADLVFPSEQVAVFLDGCYWHGCPEHYKASKTNVEFWRTKIESNRARDQETAEMLEQAGWLVVRVWEHEDPRAAAQDIREIVIARRKSMT